MTLRVTEGHLSTVVFLRSVHIKYFSYIAWWRSQMEIAQRCRPDSPKLGFRVRVRVSVSANRDWTRPTLGGIGSRCAWESRVYLPSASISRDLSWHVTSASSFVCSVTVIISLARRMIVHTRLDWREMICLVARAPCAFLRCMIYSPDLLGRASCCYSRASFPSSSSVKSLPYLAGHE